MPISVMINLIVCILSLPILVSGYAFRGISNDPNGCTFKSGNISTLYPAGSFRPSPEKCEICNCNTDTPFNVTHKYSFYCYGCSPYGGYKCRDSVEIELIYPHCCQKPACWIHE